MNWFDSKAAKAPLRLNPNGSLTDGTPDPNRLNIGQFSLGKLVILVTVFAALFAGIGALVRSVSYSKEYWAKSSRVSAVLMKLHDGTRNYTIRSESGRTATTETFPYEVEAITDDLLQVLKEIENERDKSPHGIGSAEIIGSSQFDQSVDSFLRKALREFEVHCTQRFKDVDLSALEGILQTYQLVEGKEDDIQFMAIQQRLGRVFRAMDHAVNSNYRDGVPLQAHQFRRVQSAFPKTDLRGEGLVLPPRISTIYMLEEMATLKYRGDLPKAYLPQLLNSLERFRGNREVQPISDELKELYGWPDGARAVHREQLIEILDVNSSATAEVINALNELTLD